MIEGSFLGGDGSLVWLESREAFLVVPILEVTATVHLEGLRLTMPGPVAATEYRGWGLSKPILMHTLIKSGLLRMRHLAFCPRLVELDGSVGDSGRECSVTTTWSTSDGITHSVISQSDPGESFSAVAARHYELVDIMFTHQTSSSGGVRGVDEVLAPTADDCADATSTVDLRSSRPTDRRHRQVEQRRPRDEAPSPPTVGSPGQWNQPTVTLFRVLASILAGALAILLLVWVRLHKR